MKSFFGWLKNSTKIKRWIVLMILGMLLACYGFSQIIASKESISINRFNKNSSNICSRYYCIYSRFSIHTKRTLELAVLQDAKNIRELGDTKDKGPKIVVIGGGAGLNRVLKGLKNYTNNLTAIVTVSSYGNHTKRKPTDDIRNSIIALAKDSNEMEKLMNLPNRDNTFGDTYF